MGKEEVKVYSAKEVLEILIESNGGSLDVNKYRIIQQEEGSDDSFLRLDDSGGVFGTAETIINSLK